MKIERLVLSIATNQFTVPLPTGKEVIRAVNSHAALVAALQSAFDYYMGEHACGDFTCACGDCGTCAMRESTRAALALVSTTAASE